MGEARYMVGWPSSRQNFKNEHATMCQSTANAWAVFSFFKSWQAGWPANHVSGFPHPCYGHIVGIGILSDVFPFYSRDFLYYCMYFILSMYFGRYLINTCHILANPWWVACAQHRWTHPLTSTLQHKETSIINQRCTSRSRQHNSVRFLADPK